jgi:phage baseplate assembly protein W
MPSISGPGNSSLRPAFVPSLPAAIPQTSLTDVRNNPLQQIGPTGIKFPFRFTATGRVGVSTTNVSDTSHIRESVQQILLTHVGERFMLPAFGCPIKELVFEPLGEVEGLLRQHVLTALLSFQPNITIKAADVQVIRDYVNDAVYFTVTYVIKSINLAQTQTIGVAQ